MLVGTTIFPLVNARIILMKGWLSMKKTLSEPWFASFIQLVTSLLSAGSMVVAEQGTSVGPFFFCPILEKMISAHSRYSVTHP